MNNLSLTKVSTNLTPKERAKLVISYQLKAFQHLTEADIQKYKDGEEDDIEVFGDREVKQLIAGCPTEQGKDYNFYISLKQQIWSKIVQDIHDLVNRLEILDGRMAHIRYLLSTSPFMQHAADELKRTPVIVKKADYDKAVEETREYERARVLELEGRFNLAEQEAYAVLLSQGRVRSDGDLDSYLDYMNDFGKTEEELLTAKVAEIHEGIDKYLRVKERLEGDEPFLKYYSEYVGLDEVSLRAKVKEKYAEYLTVPTEQGHHEWLQLVKEQKQRLLQAVQSSGELRAKENGIEAGSYYDWKDRHQKFAGEENSTHQHWHPLHEECMEIGYSADKVMNSSQAKFGDWRQIVVATLHNENFLGYAGKDFGKTRIQSVVKMLEQFVVVELSERDVHSEVRTIRLTNKSCIEALQLFTQRSKEILQDLADDFALIKAVEEKYFDGMELVTNNETTDYLSVAFFYDQAKAVVHRHNEEIRDVEKTFNKLSLGFWDHKFENMESFLVDEQVTPNNESVAKQLARVEREARE